MSTTSTTNSLAAGVQQLYNSGLLSSGLSSSVLNSSSPSQLNQLAKSTIAQQESAVLLGISSGSGDTASLSDSAASSLLTQTDGTSSSTTDPLTAAVDNALTSNLNAAVNQFLPQSSSATGGTVNVVG